MTQHLESITFPAPGKALNLNDREHHHPRAKRVAVWRNAGFWYAKQHRLRCRGAVGVVEVWTEFGTKEPDKRRDPSNWTPTIKAVLDGFTLACVWVDDDSEHVKTYEPVFTDKVPNGHIRFTLSWETADE